MSFTPLYTYITGPELAEMMRSDGAASKDYAIVDVRDDDFLGGNIVNCVRAPSEKFDETVDDLVDSMKDVPKVVFHCALSQQRGPKAARIYAERRAAIAASNNTDQKKGQEILVLRGGFTEFQAAYRNDPKLVENWRKEVWSGWY